MAKLQKLFIKNVLTHLGERNRSWLANESGINSGTLSTTLSEEGNATLKSVEKIADALGIPAEVLFKDFQTGAPTIKYKIPKDLLKELEGQSPQVYETVKMLLKAIKETK